MVDLSADAPDIPSFPLRYPELHVGMAEEWIPWRQRIPALEMQRRDVMGIVAVEALGQTNKAVELGSALDRDDVDRCHEPDQRSDAPKTGGGWSRGGAPVNSITRG